MMEIGSFQIDLAMRTLRQNGQAVHLGSRAFDILVVLASASGRLVTKDELMNTVWPNTVVEENSIQVHLSALRKVLGPERNLICTVPGRGYQLLQRTKNPPLDEVRARPSCGHPLLPPKSGLLGRDTEVQLIRSMLRRSHVLTLVGTGGIGKTRLAIEAARHSAAEYADSVCFVELAALTTQEAVVCAIAESCGLTLPGAQIDLTCVAAGLAGRPTLLVLDNAEHVVDSVAKIADVLVAGNEHLRVLVTSREPLRIVAETVLRVDPLDVPPPNSDDADILRCSAVRLFLARAETLQETVPTDRSELRLVGEICRRLDGIPLAIELAAARVVALGVEGVYRRLDDRMAILAGGYRTALPRHQTLRATFDWSFALLDPATRALFRRLALFSGAFSFESMCAAACDQEHTTADAIDAITQLVAQSLVSVEFEGATAKYRMSESTRAYALEKLKAEGELRQIISRNARHITNCFRRPAFGEVKDIGYEPANQPVLHPMLDDARVAYDWAFSAEGDPCIGFELASELVVALLDAGLLDECYTRAEQAVIALEKLPAGTVSAAIENRVRAALAAAAPDVREPPAALMKPALKQATKKRILHEPTATAAVPPADYVTT